MMKSVSILIALSLCGCSTAYMRQKHDDLHSQYDSPLPPGTELLEDIPLESNAAVARAGFIPQLHPRIRQPHSSLAEKVRRRRTN